LGTKKGHTKKLRTITTPEHMGERGPFPLTLAEPHEKGELGQVREQVKVVATRGEGKRVRPDVGKKKKNWS